MNEEGGKLSGETTQQSNSLQERGRMVMARSKEGCAAGGYRRVEAA